MTPTSLASQRKLEPCMTSQMHFDFAKAISASLLVMTSTSIHPGYRFAIIQRQILRIRRESQRMADLVLECMSVQRRDVPSLPIQLCQHARTNMLCR